MKKEELIKKLYEAVKDGFIEESGPLAEKSVELGYDPIEVMQGITSALKEVGADFNDGRIFLTELMFCGETAKEAMNILTKEIKRQKKTVPYLGRVVIGTVAGDIHDIGKSLVVAMLVAEGFEVIDLGIDISDETFIDNVRLLKPNVLGLSALVTTTMLKFRDIVVALEDADLRDKVKVIIGGALVNMEHAETSGADTFGSDAIDAVIKVRALLDLD
ncbi:MAG: cobalamin-dependent protein [Candidatus Bathyarchaeota archaeon]|nr:cobalamin-dependent protein [Candidatus Bathyarchaeota archaeon]